MNISNKPIAKYSGAEGISINPVPLCLKTASTAALALMLAWLFRDLFPNLLVLDPVFLLATSVGVFCSVLSLFKARGVCRLVAVLSTVVSVYGLIQCLSFLRWAINQP